jgi:sugar phosphate isomerase/epimerase
MALDGLAQRLARRGLRIAVEAFPWSVLAGPSTVPELLRRTQAPNVGQ